MGEPLLTFETPDGRTLAYALWGDPGDFPVLLLHGTPGCRLERWPDEDVYRRAGIFLITHDRAGYGRSTRRPGRRIVDEVDDVAALADHLGLERFGVTGGSGGGAHSLACAARLPDRVFHELRHGHGYRLAQAGVSQQMIMQSMGHRTLAASARYAHASIDDKKAVIERVFG